MGLLLLIAWASATAAEKPPPFYLDPSRGEIAGKVAVAFYPIVRSATGERVLVDPTGCEAHLVPTNEPEVELTYPCGEWVLPPSQRRYHVWAEQAGAMSPYPIRIVYGASPFAGRGMTRVAIELTATAGAVPAAEGTAPFVEFFFQPLDSSGERDFRLPGGDVRVRVTDARSGAPVTGAMVAFRNRYVPRDEDGEEQPAQTVAQTTRTDAEGVAHLPPLRAGSLELWVHADGYRRRPDAAEESIADADVDRLVEVALEPAGPGVSLALRLPGGAPAAGARVTLVDSVERGGVLTTAVADAEGAVELPYGPPGAVLLAVHPEAAFLVREWPHEGRGREETEEILETLLPASPQVLRVEARDARGEPVRRAEVALWVAGRRLAGRVLEVLTGGVPRTGEDGAWSVAGLPPTEIAVLAYGPLLREEVLRGAFDARATPVAPPWPGVVEVRMVE